MVSTGTTDAIRIVWSALHLNPKTDESSEFWTLEPFATQNTGDIKPYKSANDLLCACALATLDDENPKLTEVSSGSKL